MSTETFASLVLLAGCDPDIDIDCQHQNPQCQFEVDDICYIHPDGDDDDEDSMHVRWMFEVIDDLLNAGRPHFGVAMRHFPTKRPVSDRELDGWVRFAVLPHREPPQYRKGE